MSAKVTHGANVEELDDIAVGLRRQGSKIADVGGRGAAHLEKLRALWDGPDFEKFAKEWHAAHRVIDDAELALRTFSRKLAAESDQQRHSSGVASGATGSGPVRGQGADVVETPREGFTQEGGGLLASPHGLLVTDHLVPVLPDLPGVEEVGAGDPGEPSAFERPTAADGPGSGAPAQVPTGDGSHVTTADDAAGQRSVAFDPRGVVDRADWADASSVSSWLGRDGVELLPWSRG